MLSMVKSEEAGTNFVPVWIRKGVAVHLKKIYQVLKNVRCEYGRLNG